ncbi:MAG: sensor histidine kinase [Spirochaetales bacterium]|uniref:histidine kinase n=1 Tax=Candidatus Thalassospirochaeta sargassi TaxID=3119039 RepID=A0AAJ1MKG9_9SPIO|nr:sensor histidine kinase [Spirochaetales bacterium]
MKLSNRRHSGKGRFHIKSIGGQIFTLVMVITISSVLILGITYFYLAGNIIKENLESVLSEVVKANAGELDNLLGLAMQNSLRIADDPKIQAVLRNDYPEDLAEVYSQELEIDNQLSFIQNYVDDIFGFYVIGANGMQFKSNFSSPIYENWQNFTWYRRIIYSSNPVWFSPHEGSFTVNTIGQPLITLGLKIIDKSSGDILGVILTDIEVETIHEIISQGLGGSGHLSLIGTTGNQEITHSRDTDTLIQSALSASITIDYTGWTLKGFIHPETLEASVTSMFKPIFILILIIAAIDFIAALSFVSRTISPLRDLAGLMKIVQSGNFNVNMDIQTEDEIGMLSNSFNVMVAKINTLMKDLYEEHEKLRISEMKTLEAQINPHFLYNTLESIIWLARAGQNDAVIRLVFSLTNLLRIGLSRGRTLVTIEEEIEHIKNYLVIQETRFEDEFESVISIPETIMKNKTLKLILQPLVENSIYHGIMQQDDTGTIKISADCSENDIFFRIEDSGPGISTAEVEKLNGYLSEMEEENVGIGLRSVNQRIKLYFGPDYGVKFKSAPGEGTRVSVHIPRI